MAQTDFDRLSRLVVSEFRRFDKRFDDIGERFDTVDQRFDILDTRFHKFDVCLETAVSHLANIELELKDIHQRLGSLEEAAANFSGFTKEIDHLVQRVAAIEKHLGLQQRIDA